MKVFLSGQAATRPVVKMVGMALRAVPYFFFNRTASQTKLGNGSESHPYPGFDAAIAAISIVS